MKEITNIHFFGGCALTQKSIPKKDRFISVLNGKLESNLLINPKFSFSSYGNFLELFIKFKSQIKKNGNNIFIVQIRPQPYILISKYIIKYADGNNKLRFKTNPFISKKSGREIINNSNPIFNQLSTNPTFLDFNIFLRRLLNINSNFSKSFFLEINIFLGRLLGINSNASKYVFTTIQEIQLMCTNHNQLIILGIPPQPMSKQGNIICKKLNNYLKDECLRHKIHYIDNFAEMNNCRNFLSDKLHLSIKGHRKLGEILFEGIKTFYNKGYT